MKAMTLDSYGLNPQLSDIPKPTPGANQVLVKVKATSINPVDWKQAAGMFKPVLTAKFPKFVPGYDVAGEVEAVGPGVTQFSKGQRVHTRLAGNGAGACAEFVVASVDNLNLLPEKLDFAQGAGLPLTGMTALQALRDNGQVPLQKASSRVLVIGASGGVGHLAVQIARLAGGTVVGVCSKKNMETVKSLGANEVLDYSQAIDWDKVGPFDVILDCVGVNPSEYLPRLKPEGRFVGCVPEPRVFLQAALNLFRKKKVAAVMLKPTTADLKQLDDWAEQGRLKVLVDSHFPLNELPKAWEKSRSGRAVGKIIVDVA